MEKVVAVQLAKFSGALAFAVGLLAIGLLAEDQSIRGVALFSAGLLGAPVLLLVLTDTGRVLRKAGKVSARASFWGRVLGFPQAGFGFICASVGLVMLALLLYKWWWQGQAPTGRFIIVAPVGFLLFGLALMRDAFRPPEE